jgi:YVTN family beta-propeller protein
VRVRPRAIVTAGLLVIVAGGVVVGAVLAADRSGEDLGAQPGPTGEETAAEEPVAQEPPEPPPEPELPPEPEPPPEPHEPEEPAEPEVPDEPVLPPGPPSDERTLEHVTTIYGDISPKSVVASDTGVFFAQNMMYRHTITVYDRDHELIATIPDTVNLTDFGYDGPDADLRGAPVEMAFSPDGAYAYVSNYKMYGPGFARGGTDTCSPADGYDDSFIYRVDVDTLQIDQVIPVGSVPKYVAVTPDGRYVLVSNWCSYDLSIIDTEAAEEIERIDVGRYPRGIAVTADSSTAYIAVMGSLDIMVLDLTDRSTELLQGIGRSPRHLVLDPDERYLYATLNGEGVVVRVDLQTGDQVRVATGNAPRSMDISADGRALYVVNYNSHTVSKVRTEDMQVMQTIDVDDRPIGITYDRETAEVWVAHYSGSIRVLQDR